MTDVAVVSQENIEAAVLSQDMGIAVLDKDPIEVCIEEETLYVSVEEMPVYAECHVGGGLTNAQYLHFANTSNPHNTTAAQVGAAVLSDITLANMIGSAQASLTVTVDGISSTYTSNYNILLISAASDLTVSGTIAAPTYSKLLVLIGTAAVGAGAVTIPTGSSYLTYLGGDRLFKAGSIGMLLWVATSNYWREIWYWET